MNIQTSKRHAQKIPFRCQGSTNSWMPPLDMNYSGHGRIFWVQPDTYVPEDEDKMVFTVDRGLYCYKVMLFGLKNVGATYQRLVNKVVANLISKAMKVYVDNMLVKSLWKEDHVTDLLEMFGLLQKYDMRLNPAKCAFWSRIRKISYLHGQK